MMSSIDWEQKAKWNVFYSKHFQTQTRIIRFSD